MENNTAVPPGGEVRRSDVDHAEATRLRVLHLEDDSNDAEFVHRALDRAGVACDIKVVRTGSEFLQALRSSAFDLILSDYSMPGYDGATALAAAREQRPDLPFIFVSGRIGEEAAIESLKAGASDYVGKDALARLPGVVQNVLRMTTERRRREQAELALRERDSMFTAFMSFMPGAAFLKDAQGRLVYANEALRRYFESCDIEWEGRTNAEIFPPAIAKPLDENDQMVLRTAKPLQAIEVVPDRNGAASHWIVRKFPVRKGGEILVGGIALDKSEEMQLEQKFLRAQRMESLGILAGGIAHDLNNVLLPVLLAAEVLRDSLTRDADREVLDMLEASAQRGGALVKQVLTFARGSGNERLIINPAHLLRDVVDISSRTLPANISVRVDLQKPLPAVKADPTQLHQVLLNLVVNARDAMPSGGVLTLSARSVTASEVTDHFGRNPAPGDYLSVEVSDTGVGIPLADQERIFEPFYTTKQAGKGTGLGLSTSLGIVKSHGGYFDFSSAPGSGAAFRVFLPAVASTEETPGSGEPLPREVGGVAEVILVIDDETAIREITKAVLGRHAYQVLTAANGAEGAATFARYQDRIDVVLVDHKMPLMGGPDTVREIRKAKSNVIVVGMSGQATDAVVAEFQAARIDEFLAKPFTPLQLLETLRRHLDRRSKP